MTEEEITALKERLNTLSDMLNIRIQQEEEYYKQLGLGVETFIDTKSSYRLGYTNTSAGWKIVAVSKNSLGVSATWELTRAPRGLRYSALKYLPELRNAMLKNAESLAFKIEKALSGEIDD